MRALALILLLSALAGAQDARLAERDRLHKQAGEFAGAFRYREALAALDKALAIECAVLGEVHEGPVATLRWQVRLYERLEDFARAGLALRRVHTIVAKLHGESHWKAGDARRAVLDLQQRAGLSPEQRRRLRLANALDTRVDPLYQALRWEDCLAAATKVAEIRRTVLGEAHPSYAWSLNTLAAQYSNTGNHVKAAALCRRALEIYRQALGEVHPRYAAALDNLATQYKSMGEYEKAERLFRQAPSATIRYAVILGDLAALYISMGAYAKAEKLSRQTLEIQRNTLGEAHPDYATSLHNLAVLYLSTGEYAKAESLLRQALKIHKKALGEAHPTYARSLHNLAALYLSTGEYAKAEPLYRLALEVTRKAQGEAHPQFAFSLHGLAFLYESMRDFAKAEPLSRRALEITKKALGKAHPRYAFNLIGLANIYTSIGEYAKAEALYRRALAITRKTLGKSHPVHASGLRALASVYLLMDEPAKAEQLLKEALDIHRKARDESHPTYASSLISLAEAYRSMGAYAKAEPLYHQALKLRRKALGEASPQYAAGLNNLALLYWSMGEYAKAEPLYRQSLEILKRAFGEAHSLCATGLTNLGALYLDMEEQSKAEPFLRRALAINRRTLDSTFAVLSERQQLQMSRLFRTPLNLYLALSNPTGGSAADAYSHVLAWKGAVFARQAQARLMAKDPGAADLLAGFESASRRLATLSLSTPNPKQQQTRLRRIEELSRQTEELERELSVRSEAYRKAQAAKRLAASDLQKALPPGVVLLDLLEYRRRVRAKADPHIVAFVVPATGEIRRVELGPVAPLSKLIDAWRQGLAGTGGAKAGKRLRELVWEPVATHLTGAKTVLVSPDGALTRLPFAALPGKAPGSFLVEEIAIAVIAVPQLLPDLLEREATRDQSLLLIGDVDYGASRAAAVTVGRSAARGPGGELPHFAPLASTRGEILAVRDSFEERYQDGAVKVLRRTNATESAFREQAGRHRWLHVATHGFFAPASVKSAQKGEVGYHPGLLSGLALAGANLKPDPNRDDGILTALEVAALDLSGVEVAVLSACETGLGEVASGEGVLGLQRAFQVAGVRTTITSLWRVPDEATRLLMERFYENVWTKKLGKLQALREAQLWMLKEGRARGMKLKGETATKSTRLPPYYWAAFVLSGDWR